MLLILEKRLYGLYDAKRVFSWIYICFNLKGQFTQKYKLCHCLLTLMLFSNLYDFLSSVEHKLRYSEVFSVVDDNWGQNFQFSANCPSKLLIHRLMVKNEEQISYCNSGVTQMIVPAGHVGSIFMLRLLCPCKRELLSPPHMSSVDRRHTCL